MAVRIQNLLVLIATAVAWTSLPGEGVSQRPAGKEPGPEEIGDAPSERLEGRARKLAEEGRAGWSCAAGLYTRAAALRGSGDPRAAEDLAVAGHLYFYAGQAEASVLAFRHAGQILMTLGRWEAAARMFSDGAWVAQEAGLSADARDLRRWSEILTRPQGPRQPGRTRTFGPSMRS